MHAEAIPYWRHPNEGAPCSDSPATPVPYQSLRHAATFPLRFGHRRCGAWCSWVALLPASRPRTSDYDPRARPSPPVRGRVQSPFSVVVLLRQRGTEVVWYRCFQHLGTLPSCRSAEPALPADLRTYVGEPDWISRLPWDHKW